MSIPVVCGCGDARKDTIAPVAHVKKLDDGTRVPFGQQIDKTTAATDTSRMPNGIAHREEPCEVGFEIPGPIREVLQTLVSGLEKIPVEQGRVITLLDQLDGRVGEKGAASPSCLRSSNGSRLI